MLSQKEREQQRKRDYVNKILRKVSPDRKDELFMELKKGQNEFGGTYGGLGDSR